MRREAFIQTNKKQRFGALLAQFALNRHTPSLPVTIMQVDAYPEFEAFVGTRYSTHGHEVVYDPKDLQSFTLTRFKPPELMGYTGEALVIDPDIFVISDVSPIFDLPRNSKPILACRKKHAWDTSVMVLDTAQLSHWNVPAFLEELKNGNRDYADYTTLAFEENNVAELPRIWNSLDTLTPETRMLHTTERLTQPWKTGLPIDFTRKPLQKKFGIIPREWLYRMTGRYPSHYQPHPNKEVVRLFFTLAHDALTAGAITRGDIEQEITLGHIRPDFFSAMEQAIAV